MEPINPLNHSFILMKLFIITAVGIFSLGPSIEFVIGQVFSKFKFNKESGWLLQFWACSSSTPPKSEDIGCNLTLTDQPFVSTADHQGLEDYRRRCLEIEEDDCFVGLETNVRNWFAGRAAQTRIADQRTEDFVLSQDSDSAEAPGKGQLVLPVFSGEKFVGIIELVTIVPKQSYSEAFEQLCQLLQAFGLQSNYMGKTIKVKYKDDLIKFPLPYSSKLADLQREVTERFKELEQRIFRINYEHANGNRYPISSDADLQLFMAESSSRGETVIRMYVEVVM